MKYITKQEYDAILEKTFGECMDLGHTKGVEYAGSEKVLENAHANFDRLAVKLDIHPMAILNVLLTKHMDSIDDYIRKVSRGATPSLSEPIEGRINDAIVYMVLLKAMVIRYQIKTSAIGNMSDAELLSHFKKQAVIQPSKFDHIPGEVKQTLPTSLMPTDADQRQIDDPARNLGRRSVDGSAQNALPVQTWPDDSRNASGKGGEVDDWVLGAEDPGTRQ